MMDDQERHSGFGTHHDRFLTNGEMLLIGVGLYRAMSWFSTNRKRLSPQEQAQYEIDTARWKAYLLWESETFGAREAREAYQAEQEAVISAQVAERQLKARRLFWWRPVTFVAAIIVGANWLGTDDGAADLNPIVFTIIAVTVWATLWHLGLRVRRSFGRVRDLQALNAQTVAQRLSAPSDNLPVLWKPLP